MSEEKRRFDKIPLGTTDDHSRFFALAFHDIACGMLTAAIESKGQTLEEWLSSSGNADKWKQNLDNFYDSALKMGPTQAAELRKWFEREGERLRRGEGPLRVMDLNPSPN